MLFSDENRLKCMFPRHTKRKYHHRAFFQQRTQSLGLLILRHHKVDPYFVALNILWVLISPQKDKRVQWDIY
jgi:hypothetical protein